MLLRLSPGLLLVFPWVVSDQLIMLYSNVIDARAVYFAGILVSYLVFWDANVVHQLN